MVGPSGCGKSTLMKLATGLQFPFKGTVRVAGEVVSKPVKIAGMAFQAPTCCPGARRSKTCCCRSRSSSRTAAACAATRPNMSRAPRTCSPRSASRGQGDKYPWELSGGMQQRTSLCRALIHEPQLLMLDEPFGALDAFTREELWCVIRDLHAARKITVILVTHDLREAVFLADRIFVMSARPGRILAERVVDLPRPRDLEVTFTPEFTGHRARAARAHREGAAMNTQRLRHPRSRRGSSPSRCSSSGKRRAGIFNIPVFFLPPPTAIVQGRRRVLAGRSTSTRCITLSTTLVGFAHGGRVRPAARPRWSAGRARSMPALYPLMIGFNAIPKVAVVPILVLWFGIGFVPAVLTAFLISFFPIVVNVATGLATIEPELEDVLQGARRLQARHHAQGRHPARAAVFLRLAEGRDHARLRRLGDLRERRVERTASAT